MLFSNIYKNKTVLVTGHNGFKGAGLSLWLKNLGAKVTGISLKNLEEKSFFKVNGISEIARELLIDVLDALARLDAKKAKLVWEGDEELDAQHNIVYKKIYRGMVEKGSSASDINALFIAKNIERIGDYCTSIAEQIYFIVNAEMLDEKRPKTEI